MIRTYAPGHSPIHHANNAGPASVGLQGAALISELRRVQMYLESERFRECERFPHAVDVRPAHSGSDHQRGAGSRTPPKSVNSALDGLLDVLGLRRRKPICAVGSARLHGKTPAQAQRPLRREANVLFHPWPKQKPEPRPCPSSSAKMESGHARRGDAQHSAGKRTTSVFARSHWHSFGCKGQKRAAIRLHGQARIYAIDACIRASPHSICIFG